jgi:hypothetical protein
MANGWTWERRERQSAAIQQWRPWVQSTGPRTAEGRRRVSRNAYRGGQRPAFRAFMRQVDALFNQQGDVLQGLRKVKR